MRGKRKFTLAGVSLAAVIIGLFTDLLSGGEFNAALAVILGLYGASNVADKKNGGEG